MATIKDMLRHDLILDDIKASDKTGVLREFAALLRSAEKIKDEDELVRVLLERELLGSTGIGDGVAIPHGKLHIIPEMIVAFGRSRNGVNYDSIDSKPVYLFFLLVTPEDMPGEHLRALARISRIFKNPALRDNLRRASERDELLRLIYEEDSRYPQPVAVQR